MSGYSVATSNVYDLLNDEGGAPQKAVKTQDKPEAAAAASSARAPTAGGNRKPNQPQGSSPQGGNTERTPRPNRSEQSGRGGGRGRGNGRGGARGGRGGFRGESSTGEAGAEWGQDNVAPSTGHDGRGRGGNRRGRGRGFGDGTRREFDHRNPRMGKIGFDQQRKGGHTVLGDPVEVAATEEVRETTGGAEEVAEGVASTDAEAVTEVTEEIEEVTIEPVEEDTNITFDEFIAQQKAKAPAEDLNIQTREVSNEKFGHLRALESAKSKADSEKDDVQRDRRPRKKNVISLDEFVGEAPAPAEPRYQRGGNDRGRSDRPRGGRGRGGRGRGERRGGYRNGGHPVSFDESAFPRLGQ